MLYTFTPPHVLLRFVHLRTSHVSGGQYHDLWSSVVLANRWLVAADVWEVNTEAVFHC